MEIVNDEAIITYEVATEYGFIEKLCATFGFIKCLNKDDQEKRLFFHSSEVKCGFEEMKIGDYVTFLRGIGNGKPLAKKVMVERREGEREDGVVVKMPKKGDNGSISYKYNEECFYVSFDREAMMDFGKIKIKDEVSFERVERDGISIAINVCKKYNKPIRIRGVVTCIKDKYGFIDRCDMVKEIYFNVATCPEYVTMVPGTEVEFNVKHLRNGKEEAVNLHILKKGTVNFEEVYDTMLYGTLLRCPDSKKSSSSDQLTDNSGNISYACPSEAMVLQIPFGEKDKLYPYSLHPGDIVAFKIAVDCRDELHHACKVHICLDQFPSRKETRHYGVIKMYDAPAGLIESDSISSSDSSDTLVAFKDMEWLIPDSIPLTTFMAVSYTPLQIVKQLNGHSKTTVSALRIMPLKSYEKMTNLKIYPAGSLQGIIKVAVTTSDDLGIVICQLPGGKDKRSIPFTLEDIIGSQPKVGDEVTFGCLERITNKKYFPPAAFNIKAKIVRNNMADTAVENIVPIQSCKVRSRTLPNNKIMAQLNDDFGTQMTASILRGWVVILKEFFGFVETSDHRTLYKFSPFTLKKSNLTEEVNIGTEVEFIPWSSENGNKYKRVVDVFTQVLAAESLSEETVLHTGRIGIISQPITITEITESQYHGMIADCEDGCNYPYTMMSLAYFKTKLNLNDRVLFNVCQVNSQKKSLRASHIILMTQEAYVVEIKDNKVHLERILEDDDEINEDVIPLTFTIDADKTVAMLYVDDIVQLDLDLDFKTREVFVASHKLIKSSEPSSVRKVFKVVDELQARILHWRKPRLPEGDSIGFSEVLRRQPQLREL